MGGRSPRTHRCRERRLLLVVSDGSPTDRATGLANDPNYLDHHLRLVSDRLEQRRDRAVRGRGRRRLSPDYRRSHALDLGAAIGNAMFREVLETLAGRHRHDRCPGKAKAFSEIGNWDKLPTLDLDPHPRPPCGAPSSNCCARWPVRPAPFGLVQRVCRHGQAGRRRCCAEGLALPGKKPTTLRVAVLSGLTRKEVHRIFADPVLDGAEGFRALQPGLPGS